MTWDEPVLKKIKSAWKRWHKELPLLKEFCVACPYLPKQVSIKSTQLRGFCDALEVAYSGIVYLRAIDQRSSVYVTLVMAKPKLAPMK